MAEPEELIAMGRSCMEKGRFDEALDLFERALALDPLDPDLWNMAGTALRSIGRYEESVLYFQKALAIDPRDRHSS